MTIISAIFQASGRFGNMRRILPFVALCTLAASSSFGQVTGGQFAFDFLEMATSPHLSALGGVSVANPDRDISLAMQNPALMRPSLHNDLSLNYNAFYGDISISNLQYGYYIPRLNTAFFCGLQYINYGTIAQTDALGNVNGDFKAVDHAFTLGFSREYGEHWRYGASMKYAVSKLAGIYANAVLMDVGINYYDTANLLDFGATATNMGSMISLYNPGNSAEPLPFDLRLGVSKRFKHLPLRLFMTIHHLYEWDIRYNNPADLSTNSLLGTVDSSSLTKSYFSDKLFRHFIFGAELALSKALSFTVSYNTLRRKEMIITTKPGIAGFAFGLNLALKKFDVHYARSYFHVSGAYNEFGLTMSMNKLVKARPKADEKMHWNAEYTDF